MKYVWVLWAVNVTNDPYTFEVIRVYEGEESKRGSSDLQLLKRSDSQKQYFLARHAVTA